VTYRLAIYHSPHDSLEPYRLALISPGKRPEKAAGADICELVTVVDLGEVDLPPGLITDELLIAPSRLHESAKVFGLMASVPAHDDPEILRHHGEEDDELMAQLLDEAYLDRIPTTNPKGEPPGEA
jgi:hypothetical protein